MPPRRFTRGWQRCAICGHFQVEGEGSWCVVCRRMIQAYPDLWFESFEDGDAKRESANRAMQLSLFGQSEGPDPERSGPSALSPESVTPSVAHPAPVG